MRPGPDEVVPGVDIRPGGADQHVLGLRARAELGELAPDGRLVVVDAVDTLVAHHEFFVRLAAAVRHVVCVAVGPVATAAGFALRQSAAVTTPWVTVWVGDERGFLWAGGSDEGSTSREPTASFADLLAVLGEPRLFDAVVAGAGQARHQTVSPGLDIVTPATSGATLRTLLKAALREVTGPGDGGPAAPLEPAEVTRPADRLRGTVPAQAPLAAARGVARQCLAEAAEAVAGLRGSAGLVGSTDGRTVWQQLVDAGTALAEHEARARAAVTGLAARKGGSGPDPEVAAFPEPDPVDHAGLADRLRTAVGSALGEGRPLREVVAALEALSRQRTASPFAAAAARIEGLDVPRAVAGLLRPPPARHSRGAVAALAVGAAAATFGAALLPGPGVAGAAAVGLVWVLVAALLAARRPAGPGPATPGVALPAVVAGGAVLGVLTGLFAAGGPVAGVPVGAALAVDVGLGALAVGAGAVVWRRTVSAWVLALDLTAAQRADLALRDAVDDLLSGPYRREAERSRLQEAADLLAVGLGDVQTAYEEWEAGLSAATLADTSATATLTAVVRGDLAAMAVAALDGYLADIASGAPLRGSRTAVAASVAALAEPYGRYIDQGGIHKPPPVATDPALRKELEGALWRRALGERPSFVEDDPRATMTQFCLRDERRALDPSWRGIQHVRFAPEQAQRQLLGAVAEDVLASGAGVVGVLRLVPLRSGAVQHVQPASSGAERVLAGAPTAAAPGEQP